MGRERDAWDRVTRTRVYPRDDVNTPHESTRLLGRGGRAAQFGCSRSSLVTRRNSAQVVLLCGTRASIYDLSLSPSPCLSPYLSALFVFSTLLFALLYTTTVFTPFRSRRVFLPLPAPVFSSLRQQLSYILPSGLTN